MLRVPQFCLSLTLGQHTHALSLSLEQIILLWDVQHLKDCTEWMKSDELRT